MSVLLSSSESEEAGVAVAEKDQVYIFFGNSSSWLHLVSWTLSLLFSRNLAPNPGPNSETIVQ